MSASLILTYHSLDSSGSVISISPETFRAQMRYLADSGARVVPLAEAPSIPGAVALTFDDGFGNFHEHAFPLLQQHGFPATVFVVSGYCGRRNDWPSQVAGIPLFDLMNWQQVKEISRHGVAIGAHTVNHPRLTGLPEVEIERELSVSRKEIEDRTGAAVESFAYPYGDSNEAVRRCAERHFRLACGTGLRYATGASGMFDLPRLDVYYLRNPWWFAGVGKTRGRAYIMARRWMRELGIWSRGA